MALALTAGLGLSACGSSLPGLPQEDTAGEAAPTEQLPAQPAPSPQAAQDLPGEVTEGVFAEAAAESEAAQDLRVVAVGPLDQGGDTLAALADDSLLLWNSGQDKARAIDLPDACVDLATSGEGVAVSCGNQLLEFDAEGRPSRDLTVEGELTTGTFTDQGIAVVALKGEDRAYFFDAEGEEVADEIVSKDSDRSVLVQPKDGAQRIAQVDRTRTSISDIAPDEHAYNAALRIGQGVGQAASGSGADGVVVASDTKQDQFLLYAMNDVIRLHQSGPTGASPYAVAWDSDRDIAWVSTTQDNKLTGFDVRTGAPVTVATVDTVASVAGVFVQTNGDITVVGGDGAVQIIPASEINDQVETNSDKAAEEFPSKKAK